MFKRIWSWLRTLPTINADCLAPFDLVFDGIVPNAPAAKIFGEDRFRVCLFPETEGGRRDACGATCYWLELQFLDIRQRKWEPVLCTHEASVSVMQDVLKEVSRFLERPRN